MVQNRVAEITGDLPPDTELQIERMTPAIFPVFILSLTGTLPTPDLYDYANFVVKPEIARVPGAGIIEVLASDTREIEVVLDPAQADGGRADRRRRLRRAHRRRTRSCRSAASHESGQQHLALASGLWKNVDEIAQAPVHGQERRDASASSDLGTVTPGAPDRTLLVTGNGRDAVSMSISQQIGANILDLKAGVDGVAGQPREDAAGRHHGSPASTTSPSSSRSRSPASATPS